MYSYAKVVFLGAYMGFFDLFKKKKKIQNAATEDAEKFILRLFEDKRENEALKLSAVYSAISIRSNTMSKIPFSIINRFTKEKIDDPELYNILNIQPNPKMNASVFKKLLSTWELYFGEAYCIPIRKFRSTIIEKVIPVHPDNVSKFTDEKNNLWYDIKVDNKTERFRYDEVIHLKAMTLDGVNGVSPLEYARQTVQAGLNQEAFSEDFYENYGRPLDYLKTATNLSDRLIKVPITKEDGTKDYIEKSAKDVMREKWQQAQNGKNRFSIAILDNGLEYGTVPQITQEQMEFVSSKVANVEDIARFFDMASFSFMLVIVK